MRRRTSTGSGPAVQQPDATSPAGVGHDGDRGSVTAETAVVLPVLVLVLAALVFALACVAAQLRCVDAARSAARLAARGEPDAAVVEAARAAGPPGAVVRLSRSGDRVVVLVDASVSPFGAVRGLGRVPVSARAAALREESVGVAPGLLP